MRRWWGVTAEGYLARVPKALILEAVREEAGGGSAALLDGKGWLPRALRVPGTAIKDNGAACDAAEASLAPLPCGPSPWRCRMRRSDPAGPPTE